MTPRYLFREEPITEAQARVARLRQISNQLEEIENLKAQIQECEDNIAVLRKKPLDTTIKVQVTLRPGDDGYDEAPVPFPEGFRGDSKWISTPTP